MLINERSFSSAAYKYGFNGKEKDFEISGDGNTVSYETRILDSRLGRWFSMDPDKQFRISPFQAFLNNPILYSDVDGAWIPGVDENGNIILTPEKGDDYTSLIKFFGNKANARKYLPIVYHTLLGAQTAGLNKPIKLKPSVYSRAIKDAMDHPKKYKPLSEMKTVEEKENAPKNYNCHMGSLDAAAGKELYDKKRSDEDFKHSQDRRDEVLDECYEPGTPQNAIFGSSLVTMGFEHTAVFFGRSMDGTVYIFSKDDPYSAPTITPVIEKIRYNDPVNGKNKYGFGPVRGVNNNNSDESDTYNKTLDCHTGQTITNKNSTNTGYYNVKKND